MVVTAVTDVTERKGRMVVMAATDVTERKARMVVMAATDVMAAMVATASTVTMARTQIFLP